MDAKEIVKGLIEGSAAVDRMKKEVEAVVRMILGFVALETGWSFEPKTIKGEKCEWIIHNAYGGKLSARCKIDLGFAWSLAYSSYQSEIAFSSENAKAVHEALPTFVEGITAAFPDISKNWQFLLDAAK